MANKEFSWTKEQEAAITRRNKSLLVSASAGSGKTTVMIERIVELMLGKGENTTKTPITNFLIVTFTKASAVDMKKKLIDKLLELDADDYILDQIESVSVADISDLHSFYSKLISTYFYEVELDPSYKIVDGDEANNLKEKAISKLFEEKEKQGDVEYFKLFDIFQVKRKNDKLKEAIFKLNDFLNSINDGEKWFVERLEESYNSDLKTNICANKINDYVCSAILDDAKMCDDFAEKSASLGYVPYYNNFTDFSSILRAVKRSNSLAVNMKNLKEMKFPATKTPPEEYLYLKDEAEFIKDTFKSHIKNYKVNLISDDEEFLKKGIIAAKRNLEEVFKLTKEFNEIYSKLKRDVNGLDFNDLEKFAVKILENPAIRKSVQDKYKYVFVDEYQDINEVQEKVINMVSNKTNRFMVGDIKQSIYRFRHCDPEIFVNKTKEFSAAQDYAELIKLNCNFRSDKKILKFVDMLFAGVMTENFGGVDYQKDSMFVPGENNCDNELAVNLCYIDTTKTKQEKELAKGVYSVKNHKQEEFEDTQKVVAEANFVAAKIAELCDKTKENCLQYSDVAILVQSRNAETIKFLDILRKYGIPIASDEKYDLMAKNYTEEIINFIVYVCSNQDDILLFKVLKSKLFGFSDEELVEIRKLDMKARFFETIELYKSISNEKLKAKIESFFAKVEKYKKIVGKELLQVVAKMVVSDFELDKINLFSVDGEKINSEIDKFISRLPNKTAYDFIVNYPNFAMEFENEFAGNAVNVMTIHKSKGIEFKAVFVVNTSKQFNLRNTTDMVIYNKNYGAGLDYFDSETRTKKSSIPIEAIRIFETRKLVEEQQRLLYVAVTRAKQKLFIVCSKQKKQLSKEFPHHPKSFINWFEPIISKELEGEHSELINFETFDISELLQMPEQDKKQILFESKTVASPEPLVYEFNDSISVPLKNSISKIIHKNQNNAAINLDEEYENYKFSEDDITPAERGTIYHKFFENIDFKLKDTEKEIAAAKEKLTDEEQAVIDFDKAKTILNFDVFKNIGPTAIVLKEREFYAKMPVKLYDKSIKTDDEFIMQGVIDLLIIEGDDMILLDYKTGKISDEKLTAYELQLSAYADVCERAFGKKVKSKFLCFIDLQKIIEI